MTTPGMSRNGAARLFKPYPLRGPRQPGLQGSMMKSLALFALLAPALASAGSVGFDQAKRLADENEASLSSQQASLLLEAQGNALGEAMASCASPGMDFSAFTMVFRLNPDGSVAESWRKGETPLARCTHASLLKSGIQGTWQQPFYTSIEMSFTES